MQASWFCPGPRCAVRVGALQNTGTPRQRMARGC
jgi:hypothetical protein